MVPVIPSLAGLQTCAAAVRDYYNAFNRKDYETMLSLVHDAVEHRENQGATRIGKPLFREFLFASHDAYDETLQDMVIFTSFEAGRVAAEFTVNGVYLKSQPGLPPAHGQAYSLAAGAFLSLHDGTIARISTYYNLKDWLRQVGGSKA